MPRRRADGDGEHGQRDGDAASGGDDRVEVGVAGVVVVVRGCPGTRAGRRGARAPRPGRGRAALGQPRRCRRLGVEVEIGAGMGGDEQRHPVEVDLGLRATTAARRRRRWGPRRRGYRGAHRATDLRLACGRGSPCALPLPRSPWPHALRAPGRRQRLAREHHAGLRRAPSPSATATSRPMSTSPPTASARLPRRSPRSGHRPDRRDRRARLPRGRATRGSTGGSPSRCWKTSSARGPELRINIDPKHDGVVEALAAVIERTGARRPRVHRLVLRPAHRPAPGRCSAPGLCTSLGPEAVARLRGRRYGLPAGSFPGQCSPGASCGKGATLVDERFVATAHALDLAGARLDRRRARRDGPPPRPRGRRHHDRPPRRCCATCSSAAAPGTPEPASALGAGRPG